MNSDFNELLCTFNRHEVRYLVVGGHAVMFYTEPRYTKDLTFGLNPAMRTRREFFERSPSSALRLPA